MIEKSTIRAVYRRAKGKCEVCKGNPSDFHHIFRKNSYFGSDRDDKWNLILLCKKCHTKLHFKGDRELDNKLLKIALTRYNGENYHKLRKIYDKRTN